MIHGQVTKVVAMGDVAVVSTAATSAETVDCVGFDYAVVDVVMEAATNTESSAKWTALKLQHATTTDATNATDISGAVGTTNATATATQFVLPVFNDPNNGGVVRFCVDLRDKERFLRVERHAPASHPVGVAVCTLSRGEKSPTNAATMGAGSVVFV